MPKARTMSDRGQPVAESELTEGQGPSGASGPDVEEELTFRSMPDTESPGFVIGIIVGLLVGAIVVFFTVGLFGWF